MTRMTFNLFSLKSVEHKTRVTQQAVMPHTGYLEVIQFSSGHDGIDVLRKAHMCSTPSLISVSIVTFEMVLMFIWLTMALSRPVKEDHLVLPLFMPLSSW